MTKQTRIALVGAGQIGRMHLTHILREARLAAIVDPDPAADALAAERGVPHYAAIDEMLAADVPDGALIATPNALHATPALACLDAGVPVLIEKPLADDVAEAVSVVARGERLGIPVLVGHHRRYNPLIRRAKNLIDEGALGTIVAANAMCWLRKPDAYFDVPWRREPGAGPILINLIHDIDLMLYLCGPIASVQAQTSDAARGFAVEDTAMVLLRFANGALGTVSVSDAIVSPWSWEMTAGEAARYPRTDQSCYTIGGTAASLSIPDLSLWHHPHAQGWTEPLSRTVAPVEHGDPLALQIGHFVDVIDGTAEPVVSGRDGLAALVALAAVREAARTGTAVDLSPPA